MAKPMNVSHAFRKKLKRELADWRESQIVSDDQARALSDRYELDALKAQAASALMTTIYIIGVVLITCGLVSFVAAHWDRIGRWEKVVMLVGAMLAAHGAGIYLWQFRGRATLGHAMVILGTLIFGANIGLLVQIFHIQSNFYNGFAVFAVGAITMAWAVQSTPIAVFALVGSVVWYLGWQFDHEAAFCYYPFLLAGVMLPLVYRKRSAFAFSLTLLALGLTLLLHIGDNARAVWPTVLMSMGIGGTYVGWGVFSAGTERFKRFATPAVIIGAGLITVVTYMASFQDIARGLIEEIATMDTCKSLLWTIPSSAILLAGITMWVIAFQKAGRELVRNPAVWGVLLACVLVALMIVSNEPLLATTLLGNLALLGLCTGFSWGGVLLEDRRIFWCGVVLSAMMILGRFLEYETGLMVKAGVFLVCGVGIIVCGVMFENRLRKRRLIDEQD